MPRQSSHTIQPAGKAAPAKVARPRDPLASGERDAAQNRRASHDYFLLSAMRPASPSAALKSNPLARAMRTSRTPTASSRTAKPFS